MEALAILCLTQIALTLARHGRQKTSISAGPVNI